MRKKKRIERFINKIIINGNCWIWTGGRVNGRKLNYGQFWNGKRTMLAHRFSYEYFVGKLEKGLTIDHQCNNPLCVNPSHLKQMTLQDNILRGTNPVARNAKKTHCSRGHLIEGLEKNKHGYRVCRKCRKIFDDRSNGKKREKRNGL